MNKFTLASIRDAIEIKVYPSEKTTYRWYEASERVTKHLLGFLWQVTKYPAMDAGWCDNDFEPYYCSGEYSCGWYEPERWSTDRMEKSHIQINGSWWTKPKITIYWSHKAYETYLLENSDKLQEILDEIDKQRPDLIRFD